jgi:hypothetical protein
MSPQRALIQINSDRKNFPNLMNARIPGMVRESMKARASNVIKGEAKVITTARRNRISMASFDRGSQSVTFDSSTVKTVNEKKTIPTIHVPVGIPNFSIKKKGHPMLEKQDGENSGVAPDTSLSVNLAQVKKDNGFTRDIFETIFIRTSPLQDILSIEPHLRSTAHLGTVSEALKQIACLSKLQDIELRDLAARAEYRVITTKGPIFQQDHPMDVMCIILSGQWQMRIEIAQHIVPIG